MRTPQYSTVVLPAQMDGIDLHGIFITSEKKRSLAESGVWSIEAEYPDVTGVVFQSTQ